jgi:hypothetical protein
MVKGVSDMEKPVKGQAVWRVVIWSASGLAAFVPAVVYSCGAKQMVLASPEGVKFGRRLYKPEFGPQGAWKEHVLLCGREEAEAFALKLSAEYLAQERARLEALIAAGSVSLKYWGEKLASLLPEPAAVEKALY